MKLIWFGAIGAAILMGTAPTVRGDGSVSPGKKSAYTNVSGLALTTSYSPITQLQLAKGKRKHVLEVDVALTETGAAAIGAIATYVRVNGIQLEPQQSNVQVTDCHSTNPNCTITAHFWGDLDAFEAAAPETIIGQPLTIDIYGVIGTTTTSSTVTARARLVRK